MSTYSCLLCGQTTPMPHVCPVFAAAESPESRGERPLSKCDAKYPAGEERCELATGHGGPHRGRSRFRSTLDAPMTWIGAGARSGAGAEEALMGKLRAEADRYAEERDAAWAEQDRLSGLLAARESEVTTLRAQLAEARKDTALEQVLAGMPEPPFGQYDERSTGTVHRLFRMEAARFVVRLRAALAAAHPTEENR